MKLRCLGSRPFGARPVFVLEFNKLMHAGEIIDAKDQTFAAMIVAAYPGCFAPHLEVIPDPVEPAKAKRNQRDKMLPQTEEKEAT